MVCVYKDKSGNNVAGRKATANGNLLNKDWYSVWRNLLKAYYPLRICLCKASYLKVAVEYLILFLNVFDKFVDKLRG